MPSLVESLNQALGRQPAGELAARLGEPEENIRRGAMTGAAALLSVIAGRASEGGFLQRLIDLVKSPAADAADTASGVTPAADTGLARLGSRLTGMVFGSNESTVSDAVARHAGLSQSTAGSVLELAAAPAVIGALRSRFPGGGLSLAGIQNMLANEMPAIRNMLPSSLSSLIAPLSGGAANLAGATREASRAASRWVLPAILAVLIAGGILWMLHRGREAAQQTADRMAADRMANIGRWVDTRLPNGVTLHIPQDGMERRLVLYLQDPNQGISGDRWFVFDRLRFNTASAALRPESQEQLHNIAAILIAYPNTRVTIGGYTDNAGNSATNMQLSRDRANDVRNDLIATGVPADRIGAEGYGDQFPVADNSTESGRAKNQRISLRVTQK
ncbi:MAG TPA: OmpA family protein [Bryobacteraceae bacterium]|nr:OmpA family protein [Bryobacteraceae bacterium]